MAIKPYRIFLLELLDQLQEAIREAENQQWHHETFANTLEFQHYLRLVTWTDEVNSRIRFYNDHTGKAIGVPTLE